MAKIPRMTVVATSVALLLSLAANLPSHAAQRIVSRRATRAFDGVWSVVLQTKRGDCPAALRAGVHILGGRVLTEDQGYTLDGRVAPSGVLRVTVSAGGQGGGAYGRLSREAGRGRWQTWSGECSGEWTAARRY